MHMDKICMYILYFLKCYHRQTLLSSIFLTYLDSAHLTVHHKSFLLKTMSEDYKNSGNFESHLLFLLIFGNKS